MALSSKFGSRFLVFVLLTAVFLISGCVNQTTEPTTASNTQGLALKFFQGAPPAVLGEGEVFDAGVTIENLGDHTVPAGEASVYLKGINPANFGYGGVDQTPVNQVTTSELIASQMIEGQLVGGQDALNWPDLCYRVDLNTDQDIGFIAQSCYLYETGLRFDGCFNENAYRQTVGTETCTVVGSKIPTNTNAPVQITSVSESPAGEGKFRFIVKLANQGTGQVYTTELGTECIDTALQELNIINIKSLSIGAEELAFNDSRITSSTWLGPDDAPYLKLVNGEGQFTFTYEPVFGIPVFTDPIEVTFSYGYTDQASTFTSVSAIPEVVPACE